MGAISDSMLEALLLRTAGASSTTKVGDRLLERTSKTTIVGVFLLLLLIPVLDGSLLQVNQVEVVATRTLQVLQRDAIDAQNPYDLEHLCRYAAAGHESTLSFSGDVRDLPYSSVLDWVSRPRTEVSQVRFRLGDAVVLPDPCLTAADAEVTSEGGILAFRFRSESGLRARELLRILCDDQLKCVSGYAGDAGGDAQSPTTEVHFVQREHVRTEALVGIGFTCFVMALLIGATLEFARLSDRLVLAPLRRLVGIVNNVAADPLAEPADGDDDAEDEYELRRIRIAVGKITGLLRVGLGVAGTDIISKILLDESSEALNPLLPGKRVYGIFGFTDIHAFDEVTGVLEADIMNFVNSIALVIHANCCRWRGQCNKNLGNSFLFVWRVGDASELENLRASTDLQAFRPATFSPSASKTRTRSSFSSTGGSPRPFAPRGSMSMPVSSFFADGGVSPAATPKAAETSAEDAVDLSRVSGLDVLADAALIGFLKSIIGLCSSDAIAAWGSDERLCRVDKAFKVRMGFGLHVGWAIEGAVGSLHKIDATYLSPHVNLTARLETASKQYGTSILFSEDFYKLLTSGTRSRARCLDCVTVKGSAVPMRIYTVDVAWRSDFPPELRSAQELNLEASAFKGGKQSFWEKSLDLDTLLSGRSLSFYDAFNEGIKQYVNGNWERAKTFLEQSLGLHKGDRPSEVILDFMRTSDFRAPADWEGCRALTSK
eukprot:scaffold8059_cov315-Pinguiococcus_pyrenoidosus.AAC.8